MLSHKFINTVPTSKIISIIIQILSQTRANTCLLYCFNGWLCVWQCQAGENQETGYGRWWFHDGSIMQLLLADSRKFLCVFCFVRHLIGGSDIPLPCDSALLNDNLAGWMFATTRSSSFPWGTVFKYCPSLPISCFEWVSNTDSILRFYFPAIKDYETAAKHSENDRQIKEGLERAQRLLKQSQKRDYYKILGVKRWALITGFWRIPDREFYKFFRGNELGYFFTNGLPYKTASESNLCFFFETVSTEKPYCTGSYIIYPNTFVFQKHYWQFKREYISRQWKHS